MKGSSSSLVRGRVVVRLFACATLACVLAACSGREQQQEERAKRARQMRDVSRMLDAMEADKPVAVHASSSVTAPPALPAAAAAILPAKNAVAYRDRSSFSLLAMLAIALFAGLAIPALATFAWRRRRKRAAMPVAEPRSVESAPPVAPPAWIYRSSPFETPGIHMVPEPVDLLVPAVADACAPMLAHFLRTELARAEKLRGATRLFAVRNLIAGIADDPDADAAVVVEARIDTQLAWASWVLGDAAATRLAEAERLCELLAKTDPDTNGRVLRRRGEVCLRRAQLGKTSMALPELDRAQVFFDEAHVRSPDAETALFVARTALQRARLLPPAGAAAACSHALVHAFLAEQDPAYRTEALACRLDIQLVYESLPDHAGRDGVTASLGRSLEATGPLAPAARFAIAEAHLRDGAHAKAASLCESIWRDGKADAKVLDLWRNACRHWAGAEGHAGRTLAQSLRRLAIARSTL